MKIAVLADEFAFAELSSAGEGKTEWIRVTSIDEVKVSSGFDAFFNMQSDAYKYQYHGLKLPVFINSVTHTLNKVSMPDHVLRINGWRGFVKLSKWELSGDIQSSHISVLHHLNKEFSIQPDVSGFISARIIAMIINEACFAKEQGVSTQEEIDIAMKLGTGYPAGPFEWLDTIGALQVFELLSALAETNPVYTPSALLTLKCEL